MISNSKKSLLERIRRNKPTRTRLVSSNLAETIAFQISATREKRKWTQAKLAEEAGIANNLPRLEDPEYGKQTITTLKKLAAALDVALVVKFVPFSQYVNWFSGTPHFDKGLDPEALSVPSFEEEEKSGYFDLHVNYYPVFDGGKNASASKEKREPMGNVIIMPQHPDMRGSGTDQFGGMGFTELRNVANSGGNTWLNQH